MPVLGFGGCFRRAKDPAAQKLWYRIHLGIGPATPEDHFWQAEAGPIVFEPFPQDSRYFAPDMPVMISFRVSEIDGLIVSLRAAGIDLETRAEWDHPDYGRFGRIHDPEGNPIELWQAPP